MMFDPEIIGAAKKLLSFFPVKIQFKNGEERICNVVGDLPMGVPFKVVGTRTGEGTTTEYRTIERL